MREPSSSRLAAQDAQKRPATASALGAARCLTEAGDRARGANPCLTCARNRECLPDGGFLTPMERRVGLAIIRWERDHKGEHITIKRLSSMCGVSFGWCYRAARSFVLKRVSGMSEHFMREAYP